MALPKLLLIVPQEGYQVSDGDAVLRAKLSAGASRMRLDQLDAPSEANVTLVLDPAQFQYWRAFYRSTVIRGSLPFLIDILVDGSDVEEHQVQIIPGSYQVTVRGTAHLVQMQLEVKMNPVSADFDDAVAMLYMAYGEFAPLALNRLGKLVNIDLPRFLP